MYQLSTRSPQRCKQYGVIAVNARASLCLHLGSSAQISFDIGKGDHDLGDLIEFESLKIDHYTRMAREKFMIALGGATDCKS
jgi:hypothetical protein